MKEVKKDIYNNKKKYLSWKHEVAEFGIDGISKINADLIIKYIIDMEEGRNVAKASKKGARSYTRLNTLRIRLIFVTKILEKRGVKDLTKLDEKTINDLFNDMRNGVKKNLYKEQTHNIMLEGSKLHLLKCNIIICLKVLNQDKISKRNIY